MINSATAIHAEGEKLKAVSEPDAIASCDAFFIARRRAHCKNTSSAKAAICRLTSLIDLIDLIFTEAFQTRPFKQISPSDTPP